MPGSVSSNSYEFLNARSCRRRLGGNIISRCDISRELSIYLQKCRGEVIGRLMPFARFSNIGFSSHFLWWVNLAVKPVDWQSPRYI